MKIFVETTRFIMRELMDEDAFGMYALDSDPEVHKYLGNNPITSMQQAEEIINHVRQQYAANGIGRWAVVDKVNGAFIGWSGLKWETNLRSGSSYYDLGYRLRKEYWGQGFATKSARESLKYGFNSMSLEEIGAAAHIENIASNTILQKLGFVSTETFQHHEATVNWYTLNRRSWINE